MDLRIKTPTRFLLTGPSQSGKSTFMEKLLDYAPYIFDNPSCLQRIFFFYKVETTTLRNVNNKMSKKPFVKKIELINECPTGKILEEKTEVWKDSGGSLVIIDDWAGSLPPCVTEFFTVLSHHHNSTGILITQNLFPKEQHFREISRNCPHILTFYNHRDTKQFSIFARQVTPKPAYLIAAFEYMKKNHPYGYLWFDFCQETNELLRVKANVLCSEWPMLIFLPKDKKYG